MLYKNISNCMQVKVIGLLQAAVSSLITNFLLKSKQLTILNENSYRSINGFKFYPDTGRKSI